ncbi:cellulose-binding protein [Streptomyces sp. AK02-01A]|uniref:cellulose-binding protein n=1 Tax=Streptomyces sp. AK02-01A TaxID=3028648 RepID=UPI0029A4BF56|nr:cellulose-binding protein [Streptomyces sp. AK02-01A]MDX3851371.1 cellulose-binding protein [Streptomyces sp. AK02-01A]
MGAAWLSAHGFASVRGRGYCPAQVDQRVTALYRERADAWERAARLTGIATRMEDETVELRKRVSSLAPQSYETLGHRAQQILLLTMEQAEAVRARAREDSRAVLDMAGDTAGQLQERACAQADSVGAAAEHYAGRVLEAARSAADAELAEARRDAEEQREAALEMLAETRRRAQAAVGGPQQGQIERLVAAEREFAEREAAVELQQAELAAYAEVRLMHAQRLFFEAGERARYGQQNARARAAELVGQARARAERIARDTERVLREHNEACEEMRSHLAQVRSSLAALTGRVPVTG